MNEVDAVKTSDDIAAISTLLRHYGSEDIGDIWDLGINVALRIQDLLWVQYSDISMEQRLLTLIESKIKKKREIRLNEKALAVIQKRQSTYPNDQYVFQSHCNRGKSLDKPLHRGSVANLFHEVGKKLGIRLGTHSMRKTRGYHMFKAGISIEQISRVLNHSSPAVTMRYIGITKEDTLQTYDEFVL